MLRAQQLAAVGQLAASVAHEVRNPLTSIKMLVEAALRADKPRPFTPDNLRVIHGEVLRLEQTVQGFLDFARPPALQRQPLRPARRSSPRPSTWSAPGPGSRGVQIDVDCPDEPVPRRRRRGPALHGAGQPASSTPWTPCPRAAA